MLAFAPRDRWLPLGLCLAWCVAPLSLPAEEPSFPNADHLARLVVELGDEDFFVRAIAQRTLSRLAKEREGRHLLTKALERAQVSHDVPLETRDALERILSPENAAAPIDENGGVAPRADEPAEIAQLVADVDRDSFAVRTAAAARLERVIASCASTSEVYLAIKRRLAQEPLSVDAKRLLLPLCEKARGAWLTSDPSLWTMPAPDRDEISRWIDDVVAGAAIDAEGRPRWRRELAERELLDLVARDDTRTIVQEAIEARLADPKLDQDAGVRLSEVLDWIKPGMVAEHWMGDFHNGIQYLILGQPCMAEGAPRPSLFDRADDRTAHCVSGSSLSEGDYPVGVFMPHPQEPGRQFHLVNLPTPRLRMAYEHAVNGDASERFATISRRTVERYLEEGRHLTQPETIMLLSIDPEATSWFAPRCMLAIDDRAHEANAVYSIGGRTSHHAALCYTLAECGTRAALPLLLEVDHKRRVLPYDAACPQDMLWIAALCIAAREEGDELDAWLSDRIDDTRPLWLATSRVARPAQVGATAAALLLERHGNQTWRMNLERVEDATVTELGLSTFRYGDSGGPERVRRWWNARRSRAGDSADANDAAIAAP